MKQLIALLVIWLGLLPGCGASDQSLVDSSQLLVSSPVAFERAVREARPGDTIVMADGVWRDFEMVVEAYGEEGSPVTVRAQTKGKVILSGQSNLRIAGEYVVIEGLVFKDGYTPTNEVISFRRNKEKLANNSRVTEVVIDNYNNPERYEVDFWVMMYGKNNRFDHNHLVGKKNKGVTMAVRLDSEASQENNHRIDHNYFGPRPVLGSNGGETLRVGTSHYSLTNSNTVIENNYFDRCDGELEIISIKSGNNVVKGNVFFESRGTLTMRHGNGNLITENIFFGNGVDHTGGIRVINKDQTVTNNYMEGLKGYRFGGALVVMNGVPNSPINRYHQVEGANIHNNTVVNSDHIQLAAGSDLERSAIPINSRFYQNLISHENGQDVFTVYDDVSGIRFEENRMHMVDRPVLVEGFTFSEINMLRAENGLLYPVGEGNLAVGISRDLAPIAKQATGVSWYPKSELAVNFGAGAESAVEPGEDTLTDAVAGSAPGDILRLTKGSYSVSKIISVPHPLSIISEGEGAEVVFSRTALFDIPDGGSLLLKGFAISGREAPDNVGNGLIRTSKYSMLNNYRLHLIDMAISDLDVNRAFDVLQVAKSTMADEILITGTMIENVSGAVLKLNKETDDFGIFNADYVTIRDSRFSNVGEEIVNLYRGGRDESTFGPHLVFEDSTVEKSSLGSRNKSKAALMLHGVQVSTVRNSIFRDSAGVRVDHTVSEPVTKITGNVFDSTPAPEVVELVSNKIDTALIQENQMMGEVQ